MLLLHGLRVLVCMFDKVIYETTITSIGKCAADFLVQDMMVTFLDNCPLDFKEFCYLHNQNLLFEEIRVDDTFYIEGTKFQVLGLGQVVNENLVSLGHITISFIDIVPSQKMGGTLYVKKGPQVNLSVGSKMIIKRRINE